MDALVSLAGGSLLGPHFLAMAAMVFVAAILQGVGGLGFAMFSAPISALFFPELAPGVLLVLGGCVATMVLLRERSAIDFGSVGSMVSGRLIGNLLAVGLLASLSVAMFNALFGVMILLGVALSYSGWRVEANWRNLGAAGVLSGIMGTITSSGAPPYAIVMQNAPPAILRATLNTTFLFGALSSLALLAAIGRFGWPQLMLGLMLFPALYLGFRVSTPIARHVPRAAIRHFLLGLSGLSAAGLLLRALM
ncbi:sulfite exporter TauE/SafE family protein [Mangrovicoccus algicola]|uniref:Probable membrane transporter protein n=1 Tax=Mangrovicoccus algicola TaxID=2771008 RepID=A0A8J7CWU1_9RHOB|nr:sulfite exporter TauE/SafE family protein [Mangrovicoccus algicola]MBE3638172.1 sulfite exporter TauE/SafE family protein [Mangrovicoccus algicola]